MKYFRLALLPFSYLYRLLFLFARKITTAKKIENAGVISIGNLTVGGSGKTPHVIYFSALVHENAEGLGEIYVLTRGYGGQMTNTGMYVETDSSAADSGDEPLLIKKTLPYVHVISGKNRYENLTKFRKNHPGPDIIILDDGFQHHRIARDLDIVLIDSEQGIGKHTIPAGDLREPLSGLSRSDAVIFTKSTKGVHQHDLEDKIKTINPGIGIFYSRYTAKGLYNDTEKIAMVELHGKSVFAFSGIARPDSFLSMIQEHAPAKIVHMNFMDHKKYDAKILARIMKKANDFDYIICTEKDYVKIRTLNPDKKVYYLKISVSLDNEKELLSLMQKKLEIKMK